MIFREKTIHIPANPALKHRARQLRTAGNLAEVLFWKHVKNKQILGLDFDRQKVIGNYIVDFYIKRLAIVIEIDGLSHNEKQEYDALRDSYMQSLGIDVVRYSDTDVKMNIAEVMTHLKQYITENYGE
jgi:very-short-patch-repair endonuclease